MQTLKSLILVCFFAVPLLFSATPIQQTQGNDSAIVVEKEATMLTKKIVDSVKRNTKSEWYTSQEVLVNGLTSVIKELNKTVLTMGLEQQKLLHKIDSSTTSNDIAYRASFQELKEVRQKNQVLEAQNKWYKYQPLILFTILFLAFANFVVSGGWRGFKRAWKRHRQQQLKQ